jgi:hypothetical protein
MTDVVYQFQKLRIQKYKNIIMKKFSILTLALVMQCQHFTSWIIKTLTKRKRCIGAAGGAI